MLTAVDIITHFRRGPLHVDAIGEVYIYDDSIIAGGNSVVARCRIGGAEGDFLFKCLYTPDVTPNQCRHTLCVSYIDIPSLAGRVYRTCCILRHWIDGIPLDRVLRSGECDYTRLSILFDRMAYERILMEEAHGDISPYNILLCGDKMCLIDSDGSWRPRDGRCSATEYGTPGFAHAHRELRPPSKDMDDYPIAVLSTLLAAVSHYAAEAGEGVDPREVIPQKLLTDIVAPTPKIISFAKQKLLDVGDMPHYGIACTIGGVLSHIPELRGLLEYITTHET